MKADGVWYAIHANIMGIGWNTQKTSAAEQEVIFVQGWDVLGDPRWKARYGTTTPASGGSDYVFGQMFMVELNDRYGDPWLQKIAANKPDVFISKPPMFDRLAAGEYSIIDQLLAGRVDLALSQRRASALDLPRSGTRAT